MFTVCHTEEAELLPPQLLPRGPVYDTILIWFLILFPVLSCGVVLVFWFWREIVFGVTYVLSVQYSCAVVSVFRLWREIVL
jgi:hypothetical protein